MKLAIPTILASIVMVAGIFAFMPTYEASSVHTTIQNSQLELRTVATNGLTYTAAQDIKITGATATDIFQLRGLTLEDGNTGTNVTAGDDFDIEDVQIDGGELFVVVLVDDCNESEECLTGVDIPLTGNTIEMEINAGGVPLTNGDGVLITIEILIAASSDDPVIVIAA